MKTVTIVNYITLFVFNGDTSYGGSIKNTSLKMMFNVIKLL